MNTQTHTPPAPLDDLHLSHLAHLQSLATRHGAGY